MKAKMKQNKAAVVLAIGLVLMLVGSIIASAFQTSGYSVNVTRISFETESGTLSGLLYMPKGASAEDARPTIVTTHGYLNSAEMQDAPAIEMSRRGYVVLALDMYDHGHSTGNAEHTGSFMTFWPTAIWDAVQYMYEQDYVQKDADGNGVIAVSGHSMGGFSSTMALYYDELNYEATGVRMICAGLSAGSDYSYTAWLGLDVDTAVSMFNGRTIGKIAAHYDEFFFNADDATGGTVVYKDYVSTTAGQTILETTDAQADTWYETSDGGMRIIYEPTQIHPWNHFSKTTTADMISFYETAFADYDTSSLNLISSGNQIWMYKEAAELVALIGFLMFLPALAILLLKLPFFSKAVTGTAVTVPATQGLGNKVKTAGLFLVTMMIPAIIFPTVYDGSFTAESMRWLKYAADLIIIVGVVALILALRAKEEHKKGWIIGTVCTILAGIVMRILTGTTVFSTGKVFQATAVNSIVTWAMICACIAAVVMIAVYLLGNKRESGMSLAHYGISAKAINIVAAFCVALVVVVVGYLCLFLVDAVFKTDFRIWTFAFKTFNLSAIPAAVKYMPFFFLYYLVAGSAAVSNTSSEKLQGVWGYVLAALTNMGGILIWLVLQYGTLFITGTAFYSNQALSGILLFALVPTLAIASCFTKLLYKKTGNVYLPAFLNTILMTMMTVANTTVYFQ